MYSERSNITYFFSIAGGERPPLRTQLLHKMARTKRAHVPSDTSSSDSSSSEDEGSTARHDWLEAEEHVADLVEALKGKLAEIAPGIGDQINLQRFCEFVEDYLTCL